MEEIEKVANIKIKLTAPFEFTSLCLDALQIALMVQS